MDSEQIKEVLRLHLLWINHDPVGKQACFGKVDLYGVNLYGVNLQGANLIGANLSEADLGGTNLIGTNLSEADLSGANLSGANLSGANMLRADLSRALLYGTKFIVEFKNAINTHLAHYDPEQFPFLALNASFLEAVQSLAK